MLRPYKKLLEGFTDDLKFKDMIQVVNFGSQAGGSGTANQTDINEEGNNKNNEASKKGEQKANNIPKLAEKHRVDVLPIIIRLMLSKLIKKKGAINQKSVHTRRTIVYSFMSQLKPENELQLFLNELLTPFDIKIDEVCLDDTSEPKVLRERLSQSSFSAFLNFIASFSIIINHMGSILAQTGYLERLTFILI